VYKRASRFSTEEEENWGRRTVGQSGMRWETDRIKVARRGHWDVIRHRWTGKEESEAAKVKPV